MSLRPTSDFHNLPADQLADAYGAIGGEIRGLELRRDQIKAALLDRAGDAPEIIGSTFRIGITRATRCSLDLDAARAKVGEAWCQCHSKIMPTVSLRALSITTAAVPLVA